MADTGIGSIISGQVAGFDVPAAVDGILGLRKFEINQLQQRQDNLTAKQDALLLINDASRNLRSTSIALADEATFFGYSASLSSSSSTVTAASLVDISGTSGVSAGQHNIVITQTAQAERLSSLRAVKDSAGTAIAAATTAMNISGSFLIEGATVTVSTSDSLNDIAANINQLNSGSSATGVTASVMKVADNDFRLILASDATGVTGFTLSGTALDANTGGTLSSLQLGAVGQSNAHQVLQSPLDAQFSIDGLSMTRSSNTITDALSGVTLSLKQADPAVTVGVNISVDQQAIRDNVQSFIDAYNSLQSLIDDHYKFDVNTGSSGILAGEPLLATIKGSMSSSLLKTVPGLASDRNSLVMIGIEPDINGQLLINEDRFSTFVANDTSAIRDLFVAQGSSANNSLQFLTNGVTTPSGSYSVNVTQAAAKAAVTGATDLSGGLAADELVTITDTGSSRQAIVNLTLGQSQGAMITALNAELSANYTEQHQLSTALIASTLPATGSTSFSALDGVGVAASDTISISGTLRSGVSVSGTYSILNPATDTVSGLLSAIQSVFNQEVTASLDVNGKLTLTDITTGDSQLTVNLTANNEGGGSLVFGSDTVVTEGRYALPVTAVISGNAIAFESTSFGASSGFSIAQSVNGLGIADQALAGANVTGTINGLAATGTGQMLLGSSGNVDGLAVLYTGTATGVVGDLSVGIGIAAAFDGILDLYSNPVFGLIQNSIETDQTSFDGITAKITSLTDQMERQRVLLMQQFSSMQSAMASLQQSGDFLTQNINAQYGTN
ncbi:flagellar hook-associated protein [Mariprofundus sp. EBB-1]|uniref:flagellar filament capping protein FliD n=1 Tax=Mariprofundus sp. EBB-1 TaxID=2650971 RepID=UPI000EF1ABE9|nr:flagellar filament capping protein FliD [Mariprofundus sp. EBB-1]RLL54354.1 flagellar hook-associated protein [Mariprofundus sp. EBB-1]